MKLFKDMQGNYSDCIVTYFNFEEHINNYSDIKDTVLSIGYQAMWNEELRAALAELNLDKRIYFNGELPCSFNQPQRIGMRSFDLDNAFTDIYSICPYTADWANKKYFDGKEKFKRVLFPIEEKNVISSEKIYDTVFYGSICGRDHVDAVNAMKGFKYNFFTLGYQHWHPNESVSDEEVFKMHDNVPVNRKNVHTFEKWKILSQTKVMPIYNQLYLHKKHLDSIKKYDGWEDNKAFSNIEEQIACQVKPRITEAGLFKMLMLVKRDPWNAIEYWYEPDKEFIYFDSNEELPDLIHETTTNWEKYEHIVENAFKKAYNNYTTEALLKRMIKETRR